MIRATLAPYATAIKLGLLAALVLGGFVTGCNYGSDRQADKDADKITTANGQRDAAHAQRDAANSALHLVNAQTATAKAEAEAYAVRAQMASERANRAALQLATDLSNIEREIAAAKRANPKCKAALEGTTCGLLH